MKGDFLTHAALLRKAFGKNASELPGLIRPNKLTKAQETSSR
jgi:hypothetical protein